MQNEFNTQNTSEIEHKETESQSSVSTSETLPIDEQTAKDLLAKMSQAEREKLYFLHMQSVKVDKALKRNKYAEIKNKFTETFVLKNKKTGKIVELKATSAIHACTLAGWNPKKVVVLSKK